MDVLDDDIIFEGWSDGTVWNGWSKPYFEFDEAQKLLANLIAAHHQHNDPIQAWYDEQEDRFCFILELGGEAECYSAELIETDEGQVLKVYPIGTGAWVWNELYDSNKPILDST